MKRLLALALLVCAIAGLGGCVYGPGYYQRPGVAYDNGGPGYSGNAGAVADDDGYYYAPGYYYGYGPAYDPWCCYGYGWGWPFVGFGFFGSFHHGGGHFHGHGGNWHGGGGHPHGH